MRPVNRATPRTATSGDADFHQATSLSEGMQIEHTRFGRGTITDIDTSQPEARITVAFENTGNRVLLLKFARFKILSE